MYRLQMATHWSFHPRDIDELTCEEFDHFAAQADHMEREQEEQRREQRHARARGGR